MDDNVAVQTSDGKVMVSVCRMEIPKVSADPNFLSRDSGVGIWAVPLGRACLGLISPYGVRWSSSLLSHLVYLSYLAKIVTSARTSIIVVFLTLHRPVSSWKGTRAKGVQTGRWYSSPREEQQRASHSFTASAWPLHHNIDTSRRQ